VTWKNVERKGPGQYDFTFVDQALEVTRKHGLKAALMWIGINYAAGDPNFVPGYINADPNTYTRITGFDYDEQKRCRAATEDTDDREEDRLHCPSCTVTLARPGGFDGFRFERGCFDMVSGEWRKAADAEVVREGDKARIAIHGDSGE
jgi:hypothetical protein